MRKKIALLIPHHFKLYEGIVKNLISIEFDVEILVLTDKGFQYKNFSQKALNFVKKTFLDKKDFKKKLRIDYHSELLIDSLKKYHGTFDYSLVIRPDYFTKKSLGFLKDKSNVIVAYQWDGFKRYPEIIDFIPLFDRFFTFDREDFESYKKIFKNLLPTTNFYLDYLDYSKEDELEGSVYFLGSYLPERIDDIVEISDYFKNENIKSNLQIVYGHREIPDKLKNANVNILSHASHYLDMMKELQKAECLLEFQNTEIHNGLSFRVFEAIAMRKKLITNNAHIKTFDFYHPDNIFVWENGNLPLVKNFLSKKYATINKKIVDKYSFTNWIHYVLNINPHQPIKHI